MKKRAKGKDTGFDPKKAKKITVYTTKAFPSWQEKYIDVLRYVLYPGVTCYCHSHRGGGGAKDLADLENA